MNPFKKIIWYLTNRNAVKVVKTWFSFIRKEEDEKRLHEEHELWLQILDLSEAFDTVLPTYDGYIDYRGECVYKDSDRYDITNARNSAELLMWERIRAKHGSKNIDVDIIHTPYPWNDAITHYYMSQNMMDRLKDWRLYYKVRKVKIEDN